MLFEALLWLASTLLVEMSEVLPRVVWKLSVMPLLSTLFD
jgi:hypothetical protein